MKRNGDKSPSHREKKEGRKALVRTLRLDLAPIFAPGAGGKEDEGKSSPPQSVGDNASSGEGGEGRVTLGSKLYSQEEATQIRKLLT